MKLHDAFRSDGEDRAVSPVIGVILMVAITVILAAVIGSFVLGFGEQLNQRSPTVSIGVDPGTNTSDDDTLMRINHNNGPSLATENLKITVRNGSNNALIGSFTADESSFDGTFGSGNTTVNLNGDTPGSTFSVGDQLQLVEDGAEHLDNGVQYRIIIENTASDTTLVDRTITLG